VAIIELNSVAVAVAVWRCHRAIHKTVFDCGEAFRLLCSTDFTRVFNFAPIFYQRLISNQSLNSKLNSKQYKIRTRTLFGKIAMLKTAI
uniref:Uncharacterized protein n=1 Tax=Strigamia maritima TaxID=126957 RepID=T1JKJ6_STRMM